MAFDLEWYATAPPRPLGGPAWAGYEQHGVVHGVVELPGTSLPLAEVPARRWHRWGAALGPLPLEEAYAHGGLLAPFAFPDGSVAELASWRGDLLLGVDPEAQRRESVVTLDRGATVLLYTDGLIERRDDDLDAGMVRLREALLELADRPLDELLDELLDRLVDGTPGDDVALVAVRLHRQDRPRPAEAGPNRLPEGVDRP